MDLPSGGARRAKPGTSQASSAPLLAGDDLGTLDPTRLPGAEFEAPKEGILMEKFLLLRFPS